MSFIEDQLIMCSEVFEERQRTHGGYVDNFRDARNMLMSSYGVDLHEYQIAEVLMSLKAARNKNNENEDNVQDLINYTLIREDLKNSLMKEQNMIKEK